MTQARMTVLLAAALLTASCGAGTGTGTGTPAHPAAHGAHNSSTSAKPARKLTVGELAATLGCQPAMVGNPADFREATCSVAGERFVLLDFDTAEGQRAWLDDAVMYGGIYLVGDRWALSGKSKEYLETLRGTLGGAIEEGAAHGTGHPK